MIFSADAYAVPICARDDDRHSGQGARSRVTGRHAAAASPSLAGDRHQIGDREHSHIR